MTRADELLALADKAESYVASRLHDIARDQERDLHEAIARAVGVPCTVSVGHPALGNVRKVPARLPAYTTSLDCAVTLVPRGWNWMAGNRDLPAARAYVENGKPAFKGISSRRNPDRLWFEVTAATPALALTSAALRALAAIETGAAA